VLLLAVDRGPLGVLGVGAVGGGPLVGRGERGVRPEVVAAVLQRRGGCGGRASVGVRLLLLGSWLGGRGGAVLVLLLGGWGARVLVRCSGCARVAAVFGTCRAWDG